MQYRGLHVLRHQRRHPGLRERLRLGLDGDAQGDIRVAVTLQGANPAYRDGQPYNLNLNVEGRLVDLLRDATAAYEVPKEIEERLRAVAERER